MLRWLVPGSNFGARARHRTTACRAIVPLTDDLATPELYARAGAHAAAAGANVIVIGETDPRGFKELCAHAPGVHAQLAVPPELADYFAVHLPDVAAWPCELGCERDIELLAQRLQRVGPWIAVLPFVLERLFDPRPLLRTLRQSMLADRRGEVFLAAADRDVVHGAGYAGPPSDPCRVREWTAAELRGLLVTAGFLIEREEALADGVMFVLACDAGAYAAHLERLSLPPPGITYLLVATEHSACQTTGGIGAYCAQMERAYGGDRLGFLLLLSPADLQGERRSVRWLFASEFVDDATMELGPSHVAAEVLPAVVFLYSDLRTVEGQDYLGVCALAMQARRAGLLPPWLSFKVRCHGGQTYLEQCFGAWRDVSFLRVTYVEKVALELADQVSFLTRYLERTYDEQGYRIEPERRLLEPYPFDFGRARLAPSYGPLDTLLFFGKRTEMKGFPLFLDAVRVLVERGQAGRFGRVVIVGRSEDSASEPVHALAFVRAHFIVEESAGSNAEVLALLAAEAHRAVVVLPYRGDNFPISVPEAVAAGCQILAADAGGIPEMVPEALRAEVLHAPDADALADAFVRVGALDGEARRAQVVALQEGLRRHFAAPVLADAPPPQRIAPGDRQTIGVIVPCYQTRPEWIDDLLSALAHQTRPADDICLVDDGSTPDHAAVLQRAVSAASGLPLRLMTHERNRGLPTARNTGLSVLRTDYVVNVDADDVPTPELLRRYVDYLDADRGVLAVTSWLERFYDGRDFSDSAECKLIYRPLGDGLALALTENCLGHANSAFRRAPLVALGGWDETDRSMWEDYALFARIVSRGGRIGVVPRSEILYRVRPSSMTRTYQAFAAQRRVARNVTALPLFDALRLQGVLQMPRVAVAAQPQASEPDRGSPLSTALHALATVLGFRE